MLFDRLLQGFVSRPGEDQQTVLLFDRRPQPLRVQDNALLALLEVERVPRPQPKVVPDELRLDYPSKPVEH